jgi:hypothetical protein
MRIILTVGTYNLLLPEGTKADDIVDLMDKAVKVDEGYGRKKWSESVGTIDTKILVIPDSGVTFIDRSDADEIKAPKLAPIAALDEAVQL